MKKSWIALMAVSAFAVLTACSDDSVVDNGSASAVGQGGESAGALASSDYEVGEGSCSGGYLAKRAEWRDESVDFVMNEDGSAVFWLNTISVCADYGHVTDVKLDRKEDTLFVHDAFEYYPGSDSGIRHNCICFADYRIKVPAEYIGVKFLNFNDVYAIVYKDLE
jgi:hypothetical protein